MHIRLFLVALILGTVPAVTARAQFKEDTPLTSKPGETSLQRWRVGMVLTAEGSAFRRIVGAVTVPMDWPDQKVRIVEEDLSPGVQVSYQNFEGAARQMVVKIGSLGANDQARAIVTFEIKRSLAAAPAETAGFTLADAKKLDRKLAIYLTPSPYIESNHPDVKKLAEQVTAKKQDAWGKVEAIYDWVRENVEFKDNQGQQPMGTLETLNAGNGDCDEMTSVFVAICRALGVPARTVRVPKHVFPEFYLLDAEGKGHWFPCQVAGTRGFGAIADPRPVFQRGDNVIASDPNTRRKTRYRFVPETLIGMPAVQGAELKLKLVCEPVR